MGQARRFATFQEFWPYYVGEHRRPLCRALHYVAAVLALGFVGWGLVTLDWRPLLLAPVVGYGVAWYARLSVEGNRPATWGYVLWSLRAEARMLGLALRGRMHGEVERLYGSRSPAGDAPCRNTAGD